MDEPVSPVEQTAQPVPQPIAQPAGWYPSGGVAAPPAALPVLPLVTQQAYGSASPFPAELQGWNWGAFGMGLYWGIGNRVYISFLVFVPIAQLIIPFFLGSKGNQWAWENGGYTSVSEFKRVQESWRVPGILAFGFVAVTLVFYALALVLGIGGALLNGGGGK